MANDNRAWYQRAGDWASNGINNAWNGAINAGYGLADSMDPAGNNGKISGLAGGALRVTMDQFNDAALRPDGANKLALRADLDTALQVTEKTARAFGSEGVARNAKRLAILNEMRKDDMPWYMALGKIADGMEDGMFKDLLTFIADAGEKVTGWWNEMTGATAKTEAPKAETAMQTSFYSEGPAATGQKLEEAGLRLHKDFGGASRKPGSFEALAPARDLQLIPT